MISEKLQGLDFREGVYQIDTRSFKIVKCDHLPERLYILDSEPLTRTELLTFLSIVKEKSKDFTLDWTSEVSEGYWPLKYMYVIWAEENKYYLLNRYLKRIKWKEFLTV